MARELFEAHVVMWLNGDMQSNHRFKTREYYKRDERIVLIANIFPEEDLVNGATGRIIYFDQYYESDLPELTSDANTKKKVLAGDYSSYRASQAKEFAKYKITKVGQ